MNLQESLKHAGFNETETLVYLYLLGVPHAKVQEISEITFLKRPRIYHALETLQEKGLVHLIGNKNVQRFKAEPPKAVISYLRKKQRNIQQIESEIEKQIPNFPTSSESTKLPIGEVEHYKGTFALQEMSNRISLCRSKEAYSLAPPFTDIDTTFDYNFIKENMALRKKHGVTTYSIWQDLPKDIDLQDEKRWNRYVRIAPVEEFGKFETILLFWDTTVGIINLLPELFGVLVHSPAYQRTQYLLWKNIWERGYTIEEYRKKYLKT